MPTTDYERLRARKELERIQAAREAEQEQERLANTARKRCERCGEVLVGGRASYEYTRCKGCEQ